MSRLQLALNVADLDQAVDFYSTLFESPDATGTLNHLGVERTSMAEVESEADRLEAAGLALRVEGDVVCCYARQDKHWVTGPDGQEWENYVVLEDAHPELEGTTSHDQSATCCS